MSRCSDVADVVLCCWDSGRAGTHAQFGVFMFTQTCLLVDIKLPVTK